MTCFAKMPRLLYLDISESRSIPQFTDRVWEALTLRHTGAESPPPLLPNLEFLSIAGCLFFSHKSVVRMLESRAHPTPSAGPCPLSAISLTIWRRMSESAYERLKQFEGWGLSIDIVAEDSDDDAYSMRSEASGAEDDEDGYDAEDSDGHSEDSDGDADEDGSGSDD
ncbi:hypothetical protein FB451DRAFT_1483565 [Mycena latifolia]|nr:hypothetical protein FB451DRAFT_1483565 [Mycena latifolia]